jgi:hypothetical protein
MPGKYRKGEIMKILLVAGALLLACISFAFPVFAADNAIQIGAAFGALQPYVDSVISALIFVGLAWGFYILKTRWHVDIDQGMRDALHTWLLRQASSLTASGAVKINGLQITVGSAALAAAANLALSEIPQAIARFGLTPEKLADMIVDKIPHVPSVASVVAATAATQAAKSK